MIESIIVLMILSVCMFTYISKPDSSLFEIESYLRSEVVCLMKDSYLHNKRAVVEVDDECIHGAHVRYGKFDGNDISITQLMTVTKPLTIRAYNHHREVVMKVWLGMGKIYAQR